MTPLFCVDITENRNNDRINGCDTELLEQRREDFREQFGSMSIVGVEAKPKKPVVSERKLRHDFMYGRREFCF